MKPSFPLPLPPQASPLDTEQGRQRLVTIALQLAQGTALLPGPYERRLLNQFVRGELTIDQVLAHLNAPEPQ